jgi:hypothetical protein
MQAKLRQRSLSANNSTESSSTNDGMCLPQLYISYDNLITGSPGLGTPTNDTDLQPPSASSAPSRPPHSTDIPGNTTSAEYTSTQALDHTNSSAQASNDNPSNVTNTEDTLTPSPDPESSSAQASNTPILLAPTRTPNIQPMNCHSKTCKWNMPRPHRERNGRWKGMQV